MNLDVDVNAVICNKFAVVSISTHFKGSARVQQIGVTSLILFMQKSG